MLRKAKGYFVALLALFLLGVFLPLMLIIATVLVWEKGNNILFFQERIGYKGRQFKMVKFQTMVQERVSSRFCSLLRRYSLDELPQLVNIVKGEMAFVGPRPLPVAYRHAITQDYAIRFSVKPGLTGLTQIRGGNDLPWQKRFFYDNEYVGKRSFKMDCFILMATVVVVLKGKNDYSSKLSINELD